MLENVVVVRSGGDIGTAVAHKLHRCGFKVLILEAREPLAIRRNVAFSEAVFEGEKTVEGVVCKKVEGMDEIMAMWEKDIIPLMVDENADILKDIKAEVLIDAILAKRNINTRIDMAPITIGLGPGFTAGVDVHAVIETNRGHDLGRVILEGEAEKNTGIPGIIEGFGEERVLRAPCEGAVKVISDIGEIVDIDETVMFIGDQPVKSKIKGVVRGCIRNGVKVPSGMKIGDVDPRGKLTNCFTISDKARNIAGGTLEAIFYLRKLRRN